MKYGQEPQSPHFPFAMGQSVCDTFRQGLPEGVYLGSSLKNG